MAKDFKKFTMYDEPEQGTIALYDHKFISFSKNQMQEHDERIRDYERSLALVLSE